MFLAFIIWFIYLNRNGEKVVVSVLPVLGVLIATLVTVSSLRIEPRKIEFQTHFTFEDVTKKPLWIVDGSVFRTDQDTKAAYIIQHLAQNRPDQLQDGEKVYEEIAFRVIIEELSRIFSEHWDIKVMKVSLPDIALARSNTYPDAPKPAFVTWEKISERFMAHHGHGLALLDMVPFATDKKMAIPEGTEVSAQVDSPKRDFPQTTLLLENNFVRARISLSYNGGGSRHRLLKTSCLVSSRTGRTVLDRSIRHNYLCRVEPIGRRSPGDAKIQTVGRNDSPRASRRT